MPKEQHLCRETCAHSSMSHDVYNFFAQYDPALVDLFPLPTYVEQYLAITYNNVFNKDLLMTLEQKGNSLIFKSWIQN